MSRNECSLCNRLPDDANNKGAECAKEAILSAASESIKSLTEELQKSSGELDKGRLKRAAKVSGLIGLSTFCVEFIWCYHSK
jgi:hypothetical protein